MSVIPTYDPPGAAPFTLPLSQEALEALPYPLSFFTNDGLYVGANALVEQLFRVPKVALLGSFNFLTHPSSQDNGAREIFLSAAAGQVVQAPLMYYDFSFPATSNPARTGCWLATTYLPFRDAGGCVTHVGTMYQDVTAQVEAEQEVTLLRSLIENASDGIGSSDLAGQLTYTNAAYNALTGYATLVGMTISDIYTSAAEGLEAAAAQVAADGRWSGELTARRADGSSFPAAVSAFLLRDRSGQPGGMGAIVRDLTEQRRAEEERLALQQQVIAAQQAALRELSTPLIPIAAGVVAMPLIGSIDSGRAQLVLETLLSGVAETRASTMIIDITGVPVVDTQVANALLRAAQAIKLLGARVILTGIRPEVAQTLVGLGVDLSGIVTLGTLQTGIAEALGRQ